MILQSGSHFLYMFVWYADILPNANSSKEGFIGFCQRDNYSFWIPIKSVIERSAFPENNSSCQLLCFCTGALKAGLAQRQHTFKSLLTCTTKISMCAINILFSFSCHHFTQWQMQDSIQHLYFHTSNLPCVKAVINYLVMFDWCLTIIRCNFYEALLISWQ